MNDEKPVPVIDVRAIVNSPYIDFVRDNPSVLAYLMAPATYYQHAMANGETDPDTLDILKLADAVSVVMCQCVARRRAYWALLDRQIWRFMGYCSPAARELIPKVIWKLQQDFTEREWYELIKPLERVRLHVMPMISIQDFRYKKQARYHANRN